MKLNLIAVSSIIAAGAMMAGDVNAQRAGGHMQEVRGIIAAEAEARGGFEIQAIGDLDTGYNPIEPCRIADTRDAVDGGLGFEETRNFSIDADDLSFQGGDPEGCDIPAGASSLALNVTVVTPTFAGFATVFPGGTEQPATSTVNYTAGGIVGNSTLIALGDGVDVYSFSDTDVVIDVTGYFADVEIDVDCFTTENDAELAEAGEIFVGFQFCQEGYTAVGGACDQDATMPMLGAGTFSDFGAHVCVFDNTEGADASAFVDVACCRVQTQEPPAPAAK